MVDGLPDVCENSATRKVLPCVPSLNVYVSRLTPSAGVMQKPVDVSFAVSVNVPAVADKVPVPSYARGKVTDTLTSEIVVLY